MINDEQENHEPREKEEIEAEELMNKWEEKARRFSQNEREAVEYLRWMKYQICHNYRKVTHQKEQYDKYDKLEAILYFAWGTFVELLDVYKRRKEYLETCNKEFIQEQISSLQKDTEGIDGHGKDLNLYNLSILRERLSSIDKIEKVNNHLRLLLHVFENFFFLVSDQVLGLTPIDYKLSVDFDLLFSKVKSTADFIKETDALFDSLLQQTSATEDMKKF